MRHLSALPVQTLPLPWLVPTRSFSIFLQQWPSQLGKVTQQLFQDSCEEVNTHKKNNSQLVFFCPICTSVLQKRHSAPLHIPLTEAVLCRGGTLELVKILNRFGAVASRHCCCHWFLKAHPVQKTRRHVLIHLWMELRVLWLLPYQSKSYHSIIFYSCCLLSTKIWVH